MNATATPSPPEPTPRWRRLLGGLLAVVVVLVLGLVLATVGTVGWVAKSESGSSWLLGQLPGVRATNPRGALVGDFAADALELQWPGSPLRITLAGVTWKGLALARSGDDRWLRITIAELSAQRVDVRLPPPGPDEPMQPPTDLRLPLELEVGSLRAGVVAVDRLGTRTLRDLRARLHLGADGGAAHRVDDVSLAIDDLRAGGSLRIETAAPLLLAARLQVAQESAAPAATWRATGTLDGPLAAAKASVTLRASRNGGAEQTLDARGLLKPFARWPLPELQASTAALDLAALATNLPATSISGSATIRSDGLDRPATAELRLANATPGRWNEGRLPLRSVAATLTARPDQPDAVDLKDADLLLGSEKQPAGRITGSGRFTRTAASLDAVLTDLRPALLDARAAPMQLSGPLALGAEGADLLRVGPGTVTLKTDLTGSLADRGPARAVQLRADATLADADRAPRLTVRELRASAGGARATLAGSAARSAPDAAWALKGTLALVDFDPLPWWPGPPDSPWRRGPHRLNATGEFDLRAPADAGAKGLAANLARWQGRAAVTLANSVLAGVPLSGDASLKSAEGGQALPSLRLVVDGNKLAADGRLAATGPGSTDSWTMAIDAPALQRLAPLVKLLAPSADAAIAGALDASVQVDGRWPELATRGRLDARGLRVAGLSAERAAGSWQAGSSLATRMEAELALTKLGYQGAALDTATLKLSGTAREHRLELQAESSLMPPAWTDWVQPGSAPPPNARGRLSLAADGALLDEAGRPGGWRGSVKQVDWRSTAAGGPTWVASRDVALEARWAGGPPRAVLQPGRAEVLGTALRWSRIAWQAAQGGAPMQLEAQAELEPIAVAPFLVRAQPEFGWGGDLRVGAKLSVRSAPTFAADVVIERSRGDLTVTDEIATQALGLTDLRLAVTAADGTWTFTQALAGKTLGVAAGAVVARTSPQATWPAKDTPIEGVLELQVANLGTWGTWVPAGWRLQGALRTSATIGGRFGAPEYTGEIRGSNLGVRNFVQGVNVSDGELAVALQGATARIERFTAKAGTGTVALTGSASLGEAPRADLRLVAEAFQLLGRVDRRIVASGNASLVLDREKLALDGRFRVDEGLVDFSRGDAPSLSDDVEVIRRPVRPGASPVAAASAASAPARSGLVRQVALDLRVDLGERLQLRGRGLATGLRGELSLTAPGGKLAVAGTVRTEGGTYAAYGQKLTIDRGTLAFSGAVENPRLDIEATRPNLDVRVGVAVTGTAVNPRVRLFSEPELSELDKLSWLVLGRASDGLGRTDTALLQRAAVALLAGEGGGATDQLTKAIGLDELSLRQTEGEVRETVVSLGKQLSRRWYVGYERGLNATTGTWQLIYRIAQRFTLRAQSGLDNSLDVIWTWRWQ